jgi:hypothetical protein
MGRPETVKMETIPANLRRLFSRGSAFFKSAAFNEIYNKLFPAFLIVEDTIHFLRPDAAKSLARCVKNTLRSKFNSYCLFKTIFFIIIYTSGLKIHGLSPFGLASRSVVLTIIKAYPRILTRSGRHGRRYSHDKWHTTARPNRDIIAFKIKLINLPVVRANETGTKVDGSSGRFHVCQSPEDTFIHYHSSGKKAREFYPAGLPNSILVQFFLTYSNCRPDNTTR